MENRRLTIFIPGSQRQNCLAISSPIVLDSAYAVSGCGGYSSSTGRYGGGASKGRPSTVSLEAETTLLMPSRRALANTLWVLTVLLRKSSEPGARPGVGYGAEVDDGVDAAVPVIHLAQDLHGLAHVGQVGAHEGARVLGGTDQVDVRDRITVLEQLGQAGPA